MSVRGHFARLLLEADSVGNSSLGSISLRPHQQSAVNRLRSAIDEFGGALLSDQVGMGKTFVALALGREQLRVRVVGPAVLREMWQRAAVSARTPIEFISTESLSRNNSIATSDTSYLSAGIFLVVDEAHHFRNPATRRYRALARLASQCAVLMLSATPVHNKRDDLAALLSIFMGSRAKDLSQSELSRVVVRRDRALLGHETGMPVILAPVWCELPHDDDIPELLLALPPPLPPREGGDGGVLVAHSLVRQWASSDAALYRALVRRLQRSAALISALESGAYPSTAELSAWTSAEDCVQLAFTELVAPQTGFAQDLLPIVRQHQSAVQTLTRRLRTSNESDRNRVDIIRTLRREHAGHGIVAFSQYADTVDALFRLLSPDGAVAALTGNGARVSGGRISRAEAIGRFAPGASGRRAPGKSDVVTLLLTTDILSEGVNLQDARVVVHLDLPWTPARMEQRLGRIARMGSGHEKVFSYIMRPPASADALLRVERILHEKMKAAGIVTGGLETLLPPESTLGKREKSSLAANESIRSLLKAWSAGDSDREPSSLVGCSILSSSEGFLALCRRSGRYLLLARDAKGLSDNPVRVLETMQCCADDEISASAVDLNAAVRLLQRYFAGVDAVGSRNAAGSSNTPSRRVALRRIANITNRARPHERTLIASITARARTSVLGRLGAEEEFRLAKISALSPDADWLRAVEQIGGVTSKPAEFNSEIVAIILLRIRDDTKT